MLVRLQPPRPTRIPTGRESTRISLDTGRESTRIHWTRDANRPGFFGYRGSAGTNDPMSHLFKRRLNGRRSIIAVSKPAIFTILSLSLTCVQAGAQTRPDLSGTWTASTDTPASVGAAPASILGPKFELKHSGDNLTMIRIVRDVATSVQSHWTTARSARACRRHSAWGRRSRSKRQPGTAVRSS